jgi:uncharacterized protein (TIGR02996 family)
MSQEDDRRAFLKAIADNPWDAEGPRAVYADWLDEVGEYEEAERQRRHVKAERWLREFAAQHRDGFDGEDEITYEQVVQAGREYVAPANDRLWGWGGFTQTGQESLRDVMCNHATAREYWRCWSVVTGQPAPAELEEVPPSPFSCSC